MADVSVERVIAADASTLWAMVSDITRMGEWSPENTGGEWVGGASGAAVGAKFKGRNRIGRRRWSTTCTVTECEPGRVFAFDVGIGPVSPMTWSYRFEAVDGGTRVTETFHDRRASWMNAIGRLTTGVADRTAHNRDTMEQTLANLERAATRV